MAVKYVLATPKMTSNNTPSGICSASHYHDNNYLPWYAFDKTLGFDQQTWATTRSLPQWIQYQFEKPVCIKRVAITNRNEQNIRAVETFIFQGSDDGINYVDLGICTSTSKVAFHRSQFDINNDHNYLYYRLYVTANFNNSTGSGCGISEIELYKAILVVGNIEAIGDWFKNRSYGKPTIDDFFSKISAGYLAYKFIIERGYPNEIISFVGQTSGKTYSVLLDSDGNGSALLFFDEGEDVDYVMGETEGTIELTTREVTISFGYSEDYYIDVYTMPTKRTYNAGDPIDISGLVIHKYRFADDTDLGEVTQYTYTPNAEYHTDIECAYDNAYASEANLQLFHHNGNQRTPTKKVNSGKSIVCLVRNGGGTSYGGNWNYPICFSDVNDRARIYDGQSGNPGSFVVNGVQYYWMYVGQNPNYGGFTDQSTYYNDGNYPEISDIQVCDPAAGFFTQKRLWLIRYLHVKYVGGAVTISAKDENGKLMECQYGITVN